jgi:hypothetical protein
MCPGLDQNVLCDMIVDGVVRDRIQGLFYVYQEHKKKSSSYVQSGSFRSSFHSGYRMYSFWSALGVILVPSSSGDLFAHGTIATCSTQACFIQLLPSIVLYMAALNTYFMLKIRYNVSDAAITQQYEIWFPCDSNCCLAHIWYHRPFIYDI